MKSKGFLSVVVFFAVVFFAYGEANGQVVDAIKDAAGKTKDVTVDAAKKTRVVVTDGLEKAADKTEDAASATGKAVKSTSKKIGNHTVNITEDIAGTAYEGGKWFVVKTWTERSGFLSVRGTRPRKGLQRLKTQSSNSWFDPDIRRSRFPYLLVCTVVQSSIYVEPVFAFLS